MSKKTGEEKMLNNFEIEMDRQIKERIAAMSQPDYDYGKPFNKTDWLLVGLVVAAGLALIIIGLF
jgi:hypothetical protein